MASAVPSRHAYDIRTDELFEGTSGSAPYWIRVDASPSGDDDERIVTSPRPLADALGDDEAVRSASHQVHRACLEMCTQDTDRWERCEICGYDCRTEFTLPSKFITITATSIKRAKARRNLLTAMLLAVFFFLFLSLIASPVIFYVIRSIRTFAVLSFKWLLTCVAMFKPWRAPVKETSWLVDVVTSCTSFWQIAKIWTRGATKAGQYQLGAWLVRSSGYGTSYNHQGPIRTSIWFLTGVALGVALSVVLRYLSVHYYRWKEIASKVDANLALA